MKRDVRDRWHSAATRTEADFTGTDCDAVVFAGQLVLTKQQVRDEQIMAKSIYSGIMSLDGYVADQAGTFDWSVPNTEVHTAINDPRRARVAGRAPLQQRRCLPPLCHQALKLGPAGRKRPARPTQRRAPLGGAPA